ncbi:MAG: hypothetical protein M1828_006107 [Chrysothrix sp. TS-e1954]|nr:MAG: hypothetical protein M1828_006107 [Chrysothrix sp. TS-e1954]
MPLLAPTTTLPLSTAIVTVRSPTVGAQESELPPSTTATITSVVTATDSQLPPLSSAVVVVLTSYSTRPASYVADSTSGLATVPSGGLTADDKATLPTKTMSGSTILSATEPSSMVGKTSTKPSTAGLSSGEIVGIGVGVGVGCLGLLALAAATWLLLRARRGVLARGIDDWGGRQQLDGEPIHELPVEEKPQELEATVPDEGQIADERIA